MLLNSKLIKSITIVNHKQTFEISTGQQLADMIKRVAKETFNNEDYYINESIMFGILYDDEIFSHLQIAVNHAYFYEGGDIEEIAEIAKGNAKKYKELLEDTIEFLKDHDDLLQLDKRMEYEDLALSHFGRAADEFNQSETDDFIMNTLLDQLVVAMKKRLSAEDLKDKETARRVLRSLAVYCEIEDFSFFITEDNKYNVLIKDNEILDLNIAKFKECINQMFECDTKMIKEYELDEDEYYKIFASMTARDTTLISVNTHM